MGCRYPCVCRLGVIAPALALWIGAAGCGPPGGEPPALQGAVLVLLDTVRADHLSAYGYPRPTSPELEALAERGVLFEQVVSYAPWTLPSVAALLTGGSGWRFFRDGRLQSSLVESIRDAGFVTAAFTEGGFVSRQLGMDRGFQHYVEEEGEVQLLEPGQPRNPDPQGGIEHTFGQAMRWIRDHHEERFFLLVHTYEPHGPYTRRTFADGMDPGSVGDTLSMESVAALQDGSRSLSDSEIEYVKALYDGGLLESDRWVGRLLRTLDELGLRDRTLVVVTSDHGEELGEHFASHVADHGHALYDEQLLVPLILDNPREDYPVRRVSAQVRTMDILPTIVDILGIAGGIAGGVAGEIAGGEGATLTPLMRNAEQGGRMAFGGGTKVEPPRSFVRQLGYKFVEVEGEQPEASPLGLVFPSERLHDLHADPGEQVDVAARHPKIVERMRAALEETRRGARTTVFEIPDDADPELLERLRSLGYIR